MSAQRPVRQWRIRRVAILALLWWSARRRRRCGAGTRTRKPRDLLALHLVDLCACCCPSPAERRAQHLLMDGTAPMLALLQSGIEDGKCCR